MAGLEPATFCMASRRSSQLSYIRAVASIAARPPSNRLLLGGVERVVHELVGELVVLAADRRVGDGAELAGDE